MYYKELTFWTEIYDKQITTWLSISSNLFYKPLFLLRMELLSLIIDLQPDHDHSSQHNVKALNHPKGMTRNKSQESGID